MGYNILYRVGLQKGLNYSLFYPFLFLSFSLYKIKIPMASKSA